MSIYRDAHARIRWGLARDKLVVTVAIAGLAAAVGTLFTAVTQYRDLRAVSSRSTVQIEADAQIAEFRRELDILSTRLRAIQQLAASGAPVSDEAALVKQVESRIAVIERGLVDTPEKALSVPMMRRDLVALERSSDTQISSLRDDVARLYTLMLWLIGIIVTIALGLVGLIFALGRAKKDDAQKSTA